MRKSSSQALVLSLLGLCLAMSTSSAQAAASAGPYYAMPSWDQTLPADARFIVLTNMSSAAVLDRETGLVWEKAPSQTVATWSDAEGRCVRSTVGGRKGWRLPSIQELSSLVDPTQHNPALPTGHPFVVTLQAYWSSTVTNSPANEAWGVIFTTGNAAHDSIFTSTYLVWCVRGGTGNDAQGD